MNSTKVAEKARRITSVKKELAALGVPRAKVTATFRASGRVDLYIGHRGERFRSVKELQRAIAAPLQRAREAVARLCRAYDGDLRARRAATRTATRAATLVPAPLAEQPAEPESVELSDAAGMGGSAFLVSEVSEAEQEELAVPEMVELADEVVGHADGDDGDDGDGNDGDDGDDGDDDDDDDDDEALALWEARQQHVNLI
jgi:hypothetical protein